MGLGIRLLPKQVPLPRLGDFPKLIIDSLKYYTDLPISIDACSGTGSDFFPAGARLS